MARNLRTFGHAETTYNRPNQNWFCGRECEGVSCALGPDAKGRCRAGFVVEGEHSRTTGECIPSRGEYNKFTGETTNADRWYCTREPANGGPCHHGPRPDGSCGRPVSACRPEASLRRKRGMLTVGVVSVSVSIILLCFARKPERLDHPLNPGPISATHSTAGITCADCHSDPSVSLAALSEFHETAFEDGALCLNCHKEIGNAGDETVFAAHTLPAGHLDQLTQKAASMRTGGATPVMLKLANLVAKKPARIACAACHREHHGKNAALTAVSNHQCQVCHTGKFHSFSQGHPEFTSYPYRRKTRIFFDHDTHFREYFESAELKQHALNACSQCHAENDDGRMMGTRSYEKTCAACHDADTRFDQWQILAFPKVDSGNLDEHLSGEDREELAHWQSATARDISPLIRILLDADSGDGGAGLTGALATLRASDDGVQLRRFRNASPEERMAGATVVSAILNRIYTDEPSAFKERLSQSRWLEGAARQDRQRLGENLADVFAQLRSHPVAEGGAAGDETEAFVSTTDFGGVFSYDRPTGTLAYQPGGHADPFLKAAIDVTAAKVSKVEAADELFDAVSNYLAGANSTAAGKCLKCHTVDQVDDGTLKVNWNPTGPLTNGARPITRFKHRSHIRLPELIRGDVMSRDESCAACHQLAPAAELEQYRAFFSGGHLNPYQFRSGFENLSLKNCATCHTPARAGDSCRLCHQYHATPSPLEPIFNALLTNDADSDPVPAAEATPADPGGDQGGGDLLIPEDSADDGDSLLPGNEGGALVPEEGDPDGDSLIPADEDPESESLIPDQGDGEALLPGSADATGEGDSLIPEEDDGGEALIPDAPEAE